MLKIPLLCLPYVRFCIAKLKLTPPTRRSLKNLTKTTSSQNVEYVGKTRVGFPRSFFTKVVAEQRSKAFRSIRTAKAVTSPFIQHAADAMCAQVQTLNQISDGSGVAVTISLYKTPSVRQTAYLFSFVNVGNVDSELGGGGM